MNPEIPDEFIELFESLNEGTLDDAGRAELMAMLAERPDLLAVISDQFAVSRSLKQFAFSEEEFVNCTASHIAKIAAEEEGQFPRKVIGRIVRRRVAIVLSAAAVLGIAGFLATRAPRDLKVVPSTQVATYSRLRGPEVEEEGDVEFTGAVQAGMVFSETKGFLRFEFFNGAIMAVQAPARLTVVSESEVLLESGRLNAWCPDSAHGFKVRTASGSLTDLGTSFGINVTSQKSEFVVLDGLVEVEKGAEKIRVSQGNAVVAKPATELNSTTFAPSDYRDTWALTYGILSTKGAAVPPNPDLLEKLINLEDDEKLWVIPERRNIPFDAPIKAELIQPGDMQGEIHVLNPVAGKRLSSFIIRYNPIGIVTEEHFKRFEGEVTFDRPVLAIAGQKGTLEDGDAIFSTGVWNKDFRGIELSQYFNPPDGVTLSEDRRTVKVVYYTGASTDDVRVILEDN